MISDGLWHILVISFKPVTLTLDNNLVYQQKNNEVISEDFSNELIFLGGFPNSFSYQNEVSSIFPEHFHGCVDSITIDRDKTIKDFSQFEGLNIGTCNLI